MTHQVKVNEAKARLLELVEAALKGEDIIILDEHEQMVKLVPVRRFERHPKFGSARGLVTIADDFDTPLADFDEYTNRITFSLARSFRRRQ